MFSKVDKRTEETLLKHLQAFASVDVDAIMDDYDETSVLITPYGPKRGRAEIRSFFESFIPDFPPGSAFEVSEQIVEGEMLIKLNKVCIPRH